MKRISAKPARNHGFNLMELAIVLVVVTFLGIIIFSFLPKAKAKASLVKCRNQLKSTALSFKMFAGDSGGLFPFAVTNSPAYQDSSNAWTHFQTISNELGGTKILICPADVARLKTGAASFTARPDGLATLQNKAVSFFVNVDANETNASMVLIGDRNILAGGKPATNTQLLLPGTTFLQWNTDIHRSVGNAAFCDGSVSFTASNFPVWKDYTNRVRLLLPN